MTFAVTKMKQKEREVERNDLAYCFNDLRGNKYMHLYLSYLLSLACCASRFCFPLSLAMEKVHGHSLLGFSLGTAAILLHENRTLG